MNTTADDVRGTSEVSVGQLKAAKKLHVGIDASTWPNDRGFGRFTRQLVTALIRRESGFRYTLLVDRQRADLPAGAAVLAASTYRGLTESAVGAGSRSLRDLWRMGSLARKLDVDVFFFPAVYSYFPILSRVPCVVCYHDTIAERFPELTFPTGWNRRLWQAKVALARTQTSRAMTVSAASAGDLERVLGFPRDSIDIVTEAAAPAFQKLEDATRIAETRVRFGIPSDGRLILYVGGLNPHKNLMRLLKAMSKVIARQRAVHLAVVGDTSGKGFWDNVSELEGYLKTQPALNEHIHFTGYLQDTPLVELLNGAEALVLPSLWEGFGLPAVEAMCCGVPVLASRRGSLPEVIGNAGLFFDPADTSSISECLLHFLSDSELRERLSDLALERGRTFSWERAAELAEECFERCYQDAAFDRE